MFPRSKDIAGGASCASGLREAVREIHGISDSGEKLYAQLGKSV
jgi:hypothetical protein